MQELNILALDPGTDKTGVVHLCHAEREEHFEIVDATIYPNDRLLHLLRLDAIFPSNMLAIEQVRSYGMAIGATTLDTVEWSGRFIEAWEGRAELDKKDVLPVLRLPRIQIKTHLCKSARAKDTNIRQALIDIIGEPGTKKTPGPTYGIKSHLWAALAVAVTAKDLVKKGEFPC